MHDAPQVPGRAGGQPKVVTCRGCASLVADLLAELERLLQESHAAPVLVTECTCSQLVQRPGTRADVVELLRRIVHEVGRLTPRTEAAPEHEGRRQRSTQAEDVLPSTQARRPPQERERGRQVGAKLLGSSSARRVM